ncbi:hypothetical protein ACWU4D_08325 [Vibrio sp. WJH972]
MIHNQEEGGINLYAYVNGDPMGYMDPDGRDTFSVEGYHPITGIGGYVKIGYNDKGQWSYDIGLGVGFGGGLGWDPDGQGPAPTPCSNTGFGTYGHGGYDIDGYGPTLAFDSVGKKLNPPDVTLGRNLFGRGVGIGMGIGFRQVGKL